MALDNAPAHLMPIVAAAASAAHLPRVRALALFGGLLLASGAAVVIQASENLHKNGRGPLAAATLDPSRANGLRCCL